MIETDGESSHVTTDLALDWIGKAANSDKPFLAVIWFGNPHSPHVAVDKYKKMYADQPDGAAHFYGEVTAMDAALGARGGRDFSASSKSPSMEGCGCQSSSPSIELKVMDLTNMRPISKDNS